MARRRNGSKAVADVSPRSYFLQLRQAMAAFLPHTGLPLLSHDARVRWTDRLLTYVALFMAASPLSSLLDRFTQAREAVAVLYFSRRQPGWTHEGFAKALVARSGQILRRLGDYWRQCVVRIAHWCWQVNGWVLFGFDGTKIDCPRTADNERALGVTGKNNSGPQMLLSCLFHLGSGLLWGWNRSGIGGHSEREHLLKLLVLLPKGAMLVADAGLAGYDLLQALLEQGSDFLIRVGANVHLLTNLGYRVREGKDTVYLWPLEKQGRRGRGDKLPRSLERVQRPLALRLIRLRDAKGRPVCLLSNVYDRKRLSPAVAARMYQMH